jgi:NADH-quinone oxidoreductase subunit K
VTTPAHFMVLSAMLFAIGAVGVITRRNVIVIFMSVEIMLNAANLAFIAVANYLGNMNGHVVVLLVMTVAAAEAAIGLAVILAMFRNRETVRADQIGLLRY